MPDAARRFVANLSRAGPSSGDLPRIASRRCVLRRKRRRSTEIATYLQPSPRFLETTRRMRGLCDVVRRRCGVSGGYATFSAYIATYPEILRRWLETLRRIWRVRDESGDYATFYPGVATHGWLLRSICRVRDVSADFAAFSGGSATYLEKMRRCLRALRRMGRVRRVFSGLRDVSARFATEVGEAWRVWEDWRQRR